MADDAEPVDDPRAFYDAYGEREWDRLVESVDGRLELEGTLRALDEHLPPSGRVLDAGGGAGRYAAHLAERGHDVTLVDLSRGQLSVAREKLRERGLAADVGIAQGTVDDLGVATDAVDATCCLGGPLSHLTDERDRRRAARELRRVTAPGGPVVVSVMGRLGALQLFLLTGHHLRALPDLLETGDVDAETLSEYGYEPDFAATHYFRREELRSLLSDAGIVVEEVVGLEGLASPLHDERLRDLLGDPDDAERAALERVVRETADDPAVADLSVHVLAVGRVPEP